MKFGENSRTSTATKSHISKNARKTDKGNHKRKKILPPRIELGTFSVLDWCDNHYTTVTDMWEFDCGGAIMFCVVGARFWSTEMCVLKLYLKFVLWNWNRNECVETAIQMCVLKLYLKCGLKLHLNLDNSFRQLSLLKKVNKVSTKPTKKKKTYISPAYWASQSKKPPNTKISTP